MPPTRVVALALSVAVAACTQHEQSPSEHAERGVPGQKRGAPPTKPGPPASAEVPDGVPFVGTEGTSELGAPLRRPDSTVLLTMLREGMHERLDAALEHYQAEYDKDHRNEDWPRQAMDSFATPDPSLGPLLDAWAVAAPKSWAALAARGAWHYGMGWDARGHAYTSKTTDAQFSAMTEQHTLAARDLEEALKRRPQLLAAHVALIDIGRSGSGPAADAAVDEHFAAATKLCPQCITPRIAFAWSRAPRWGGSVPAMMDAVKVASADLRRNPRLALVPGLLELDRCRHLEEQGDIDAALRACEKAGALPQAMCTRAQILNQHDRSKEALPVLDAALRLDPQHRECLRQRERARRTTEDYVGAAQDLLVARRIDPTDDTLEPVIHWTIQRLRYDAFQAAKAGDKDLETRLRTLADAIRPGAGAMPDVASNQGIIDLQLQVADAPDDFELRLKLDQALVAHRRFDDIVQMWDAFIADHPEHGRAWQERGGAKWHAGDHDGAIADTDKACELGQDEACRIVPQMKGRR